MYVYRVTYHPASTKNQEVIGLLKDRAKERQSKGHRIFLMSKAISSDGGFTHQLVSFWENLDDFGDGWAEFMTKGPDAASAQYFQKVEPMLRSPIQSEVWEVLVGVTTRPRAGEYVVRQSWYPTQGEVLDFSAALIELTKHFQSQGNNIGLYRQAFAPDGTTFQGIFPAKRLGDWGAMLGRRTDEVFRFLRTYGAKTRRPVSTELWVVATEPPQV